MFILRRINSAKLESNTCLDTEYVLTLQNINPKEFQETMDLLEFDGDDAKEVYGFITYDDGEHIMPLYKKSSYYVMTSDGKTFANVSFK